MIERAAVIGKEFWRECDRRAHARDGAGIVRTEPHDAGAEGVHRARRLDLSRGGRLPFPPHLDSRRRLPRDPEGDESAAARTLRRAGSSEPPASARASSTRSSATTSSRRTATARSSAPAVSLPELATRAGERLAAAGRRAIVSRGDVAAGAVLISRAVDLLPTRSLRSGRRCSSTSGRARMRTGDFAHADEVLTEALEAATAAGDRRLELRTTIEREFFRTFTRARRARRSTTRPSQTGRFPCSRSSGMTKGSPRRGCSRASRPSTRAGGERARRRSSERSSTHDAPATRPRLQQ